MNNRDYGGETGTLLFLILIIFLCGLAVSETVTPHPGNRVCFAYIITYMIIVLVFMVLATFIDSIIEISDNQAFKTMQYDDQSKLIEKIAGKHIKANFDDAMFFPYTIAKRIFIWLITISV